MQVLNETSPAPSVSWRTVGKYLVRTLIGLTLITVLATAINIYTTFRREQEIARDIVVYGGKVSLGYFGPDWIPLSLRTHMPWFARIRRVDLIEATSQVAPELGRLSHLDVLVLRKSLVTDDELQHLQGLASLRELFLADTQITDRGLVHLKGLTGLQRLELDRTRISDDGLKHLAAVSSLHYVSVRDTQTTSGGRESFRDALPKCKVDPRP